MTGGAPKAPCSFLKAYFPNVVVAGKQLPMHVDAERLKAFRLITNSFFFDACTSRPFSRSGLLLQRSQGPPSVCDPTLLPKFGQVAVALPPCCRSGLTPWRERGPVHGERTMAVVIDLLLGSCVFAFVTGIVIAAANLLI